MSPPALIADVNLIPLLNTLLLVSVLGGVLVCLHKIRRVHKMAYRIENEAAQARTEAQALFGQLAALASLDRCLGLKGPIPSMRGWAASPDFLLAVAEEVRELRPGNVIECSSGTSTVVIARCLEMNGNGHVYSLEHDSTYAEQTRRQLKRYGLEQWATVVDAPLERIADFPAPWYSLAGLPETARQVDLVVIDGPPGTLGPLARYPALARLADRLSPRCSVLLDDANRAGERAALGRWEQEHPEFVQERLACEKGAVLMRRRPVPMAGKTLATQE